jgi:UDP-glucose 4-epimerase
VKSREENFSALSRSTRTSSRTSYALAIQKRVKGVFNVVGPPPVPLSIIVHETGRHTLALPEFVYALALGRFGLPKMPAGALAHIKYPVIADGAAFRVATGFSHTLDEGRAMRDFREAFPPRVKD